MYHASKLENSRTLDHAYKVMGGCTLNFITHLVMVNKFSILTPKTVFNHNDNLVL